jgi:hypothetical protein
MHPNSRCLRARHRIERRIVERSAIMSLRMTARRAATGLADRR